MSEPKSLMNSEMIISALLMGEIHRAITSITTNSGDITKAIKNYDDFLLAVEKRQQIHEFKQGLDPYGPINDARKSFEG